MPFRIVPERGQVSENTVEPPCQESCDVLHDEDARSKLASKAVNFGPKARARTIEARPASSQGNVLTGESPADRIDGNSIGSKPLGGKGSDVIVAGDLGPMLRQHAPTEGFDLAKGDGLESARPFQAQAEAANAGKEVQDAQGGSALGRRRTGRRT
jgi:hypothetical protein